MKTALKIAMLWSCILVCPTSLWAHEAPSLPSLRSTGEATLAAKPDQAEVDLGVVTQAQSAEAAARENAQRLDTVLAALRQTLGPQAEIKTLAYSLSPIYRYPREGGNPILSGYAATNLVRIRTQDLNQVGKIIDTAMQAGANKIQNLRLALQDETAVRLKALRQAAQKARSKAEALAQALGVRVIRVLSAEEEGSREQPVLTLAMERAAMSASTPH